VLLGILVDDDGLLEQREGLLAGAAEEHAPGLGERLAAELVEPLLDGDALGRLRLPDAAALEDGVRRRVDLGAPRVREVVERRLL